MNIHSDNNMSNALVAAISSGWQWVITATDPSTTNMLSAILLPIVFFILGKAIDVAVKLYVESRDKNKEGK